MPGVTHWHHSFNAFLDFLFPFFLLIGEPFLQILPDIEGEVMPGVTH